MRKIITLLALLFAFTANAQYSYVFTRDEEVWFTCEFKYPVLKEIKTRNQDAFVILSGFTTADNHPIYFVRNTYNTYMRSSNKVMTTEGEDLTVFEADTITDLGAPTLFEEALDMVLVNNILYVVIHNTIENSGEESIDIWAYDMETLKRTFKKKLNSWPAPNRLQQAYFSGPNLVMIGWTTDGIRKFIYPFNKLFR